MDTIQPAECAGGCFYLIESMPILATKLYIPPPRPKVVRRPRLIERLNAGRHRKVTVISAPAGFGKTSLVSEWVAGLGGVAWLSLDAGDGELPRLLTHLIAALQTLAPNFGANVLTMLQSAQPPREAAGIDALLTPLINELTTLPHHIILVLDDYHVLEAAPNGGRPQPGAIDHALTFLIEHLPPQLHLVITTREDPQLPLARLRAQGQLTELRAADLRFTTAEVADFLNQVMGLKLAAADIAVLEARTEGWIAGLQLAALSLQDQQDVSSFIQAFAGDHRYIVDYLVEEVLQRQPAGVRNFLLQTAILDRLHGGLCDAVTGQQDGSARLEALERGNFFVVPLDDKRRWYRYHHLFADVLAAHLRAEQPGEIATLHQRASAWYEQHGSVDEAIRHALAAEDFTHAAALVELALPALRQHRQEAAALGWLKVLPDDLIQCRPVLSVGYGWALLASGQLAAVEARLRNAERWLNTGLDTGTGVIIVDDEQFRLLPGMIAVFRAGLALALGDVTNTVKFARQALDFFPEEEQLGRGSATALLGLAFWRSGDLTAARRTYADGMARVQLAGNISDVISSTIALADIGIAQGHLQEAMHTYEQSLQFAMAQHPEGSRPIRGTADLYVGLSELCCEHNELPAATQHLLKSQELSERTGLPQNSARWHVAMALIREAQGDLDGALVLLAAAERLCVSDFYPNVRPIAALKARVWIAQGRLAEALGWAHEQGLSTDDDLSYLSEFDHITLARVRLAHEQRERTESGGLAVIELLGRLLQAAEAGGRTGSVIEILLLEALAHHAQGDLPAALAALERALTLAEPQGYIRRFVDEGQPLAQLLRAAAARQITPDYTAKLLAAFGVEQPSQAAPPPHPTASTAQPLIEPLSQRELEVLRLFKTELSGPEIAQELVVALSTVRTHTKGIYSKLNVNSRRAAVKRAEALGLL